MTSPTPARGDGGTVQVLLADDPAAIRAGLRLMLQAEPRIHVVGEAADGKAALTQAQALRPTSCSGSSACQPPDGIDATELVTRPGWAQVLVLTAFELDEYVLGALQAGAAGFLLKNIGATGPVPSSTGSGSRRRRPGTRSDPHGHRPNHRRRPSSARTSTTPPPGDRP